MAQTFNTSISFVQSTSRKDRRKGAGSLSVSAFGGGVGNVADSATQAWVRNNFVDKTTEQEISAPKIFSQGIKIGDIAFYKHPDGYVYLDETLVLKGGVVMYGNSSGVDVPSIFESLPIDRETIKRDGNGALYVDETALSVSGGGVGSGGISEEFLNGKLQEYQPLLSTTNKLPYSLISGTPDLSVYFLASNFTKAKIKSTLGISDWALANVKPTYTASEVGALASDATAVDSSKLGGLVASRFLKGTGVIESADFNEQTAIGLYRYNSVTDKNSPADGTSYGNLLVLRSGGHDTLTQMYFNSSAKMQIFVRSGSTSNFTSRAWETIAFTSDIPTKLSQLTDDVVVGKYLSLSGGTMTGSITTHSSVYSWANAKTVGHIIAGHNAGGSVAPIISTALASGGYGKLAQVSDQFGLYAYSASDSTPSVRLALYPEDGAIKIMGNTIPVSTTTYNLGSASAKWSNVYATSFIGDLTGTASGNLMIKAPADTLPSLVNIAGYGYENKGWKTTGPAITFGSGNYKAGFQSNYSSGALYFGFAKTSDADLGDWKRVAFTDSNVASATKLATARTIWGQSFDGTKNITGAMTVDGDATFSSKVVIGTIPVYQSADGTLFVDANVVFRGGVAMYGDSTTTINEE